MAETKKMKKIDITDKVHAKLQGDKLMFYVDDRNIGTAPFPNMNQQVDLIDGFGIDQDNRIYQKQDPDIKSDQYVEGCDMGWC